MELNLRILEESDYENMCSWWRWWRWPEVCKDVLPMNGTGGLMVCKGDTPIAAGFLYMSNSKVCWMDWIVSNPEYRDKDRKDAIGMLVNGLEDVAKAQGYTVIISIARNKSLINIHKQLGYTVDKNPSYEISKKLM